jgi:hypothetical protein
MSEPNLLRAVAAFFVAAIVAIVVIKLVIFDVGIARWFLKHIG